MGVVVGCYLIFQPVANAQLNSPKDTTGTVDMSTVTEGFVRNMELLKTKVSEADIRDQMDVVIGQAKDLGKFFRARGTASRRRKLVEERDALKFKADISKRDMRKMEELEQEIRELDPENFFRTARGYYKETEGELRDLLDTTHTSDPVRKDIIRIIKQHLDVYSKALREY